MARCCCCAEITCYRPPRYTRRCASLAGQFKLKGRAKLTLERVVRLTELDRVRALDYSVRLDNALIEVEGCCFLAALEPVIGARSRGNPFA
ncbi:MAG: hypothetical protein AB9869_23625 [Verrucomicrobiia bacterium]